MKRFFLSLVTGLMLSAGASAQFGSNSNQTFSLPNLPYDIGALEPHIDRATMQVHYNAHHKGYVDKLNELTQRYPQLRTMEGEQILKQISTFQNEEVRNNAGGHYNHSVFWTMMAPPGSGGQASPELMEAVRQKYGSIEEAQRQFEAAANEVFGSGWVWLIVNPAGQLQIVATNEQDNPLMDVIPEDQRGQPILGLDVWEHAYYLKYQSNRAEYVNNWWNVVNWNDVNQRFAAARQ